MSERRNVLVLGGTNFIGRRIAALLAEESTVTVLNRGSVAAPEGIAHALADRTDPAAVRAALAGQEPFDAVVDVSATDPAHVRGLLAGIATPPVYVLISSAAVYSPEAPTPRREDAPTAGDPVWGGYGEAKAACEGEVRAAGIEGLTILRPPYVYGPGNNEDREKWLWSRMVLGAPVFVPGEGRARIQFCHVDLLADAVAVAVSGDLPAGTYNVGEDRAYTFDEYVALLAEECGRPADARHTGATEVPARSYFPFRDMDLVLDVTRGRAAGLAPGPDLRDGLAGTWAWLQATGVPAYEPTAQEAAWVRR